MKSRHLSQTYINATEEIVADASDKKHFNGFLQDGPNIQAKLKIAVPGGLGKYKEDQVHGDGLISNKKNTNSGGTAGGYFFFGTSNIMYKNKENQRKCVHRIDCTGTGMKKYFEDECPEGWFHKGDVPSKKFFIFHVMYNH